MGNNRCFYTGVGSAQSLKVPISQSDLQANIGTQNIKWYSDAPFMGYDPYLVEVTRRSGSEMRFKFIDCQTGVPIIGDRDAEGGHLVNLDTDRALVYPPIPSTIPTPTQLSQGKNIAILMLSPTEMQNDASMLKDADKSNTGFRTQFGKYPGTSEDVQMTAIKALLKDVVRVVKVNDSVDIFDDALWGKIQKSI